MKRTLDQARNESAELRATVQKLMAIIEARVLEKDTNEDEKFVLNLAARLVKKNANNRTTRNKRKKRQQVGVGSPLPQPPQMQWRKKEATETSPAVPPAAPPVAAETAN
eukprot:Platyproteum_vivax@DN2425_c0_g1_i1.p1